MITSKLQKINPLVKASILYIVGNGIGQGSILLGAMIFTRIMAQSDYGIYSTYYSAVSILTTIVGANLFIALNNGYIDYKKVIHRFRASVLLLSTFIFTTIFCLTILAHGIFHIGTSFFLLSFALMHAYSFFVVNYYNYSANMENQYKMKTLFLVLPNILQILLSIIAIFMFKKYGLYARIVGSTLGVATCSLFLYVHMIRDQKKLINKEFWTYSLKISVPSVLSSISYMLLQQCDKVMITSFYSAEENAVYSLVYYIGYVLYAVLQATSGVWQAWIYRALDKGKLENAKKIQKWYLFVFAQMAYGLLMISPELVKLLAPKSYWNFNYVAPFIIGSCLMVMYTFYTTVGMFYKKTGKVSLCVLSAAVINVILNYVLIPKYGGVAAAYTSVFSYIVLFILTRALVQKLKRGLFSTKYFVVFIVAIFVGSAVFLLIYNHILIRYITFILLLLLSLFYMAKNKNELLTLIQK